MDTFLKPDERLDDLGNGFSLIQKPGTFCLGTDTVLMVDFASPRGKELCVDLGCGNGAAAILLAAHRPDLIADGIEIQPEMADMALRSVQVNHLEERVHIHCSDLRAAPETLGTGRRTLVVCNPPYFSEGDCFKSVREAERTARHEGQLRPADIVRTAQKLLKFGGRFVCVFPSARAFEMMREMNEAGLAPKRIRSVHARPDREPKVVLLEGIKGAKNGLHWMAPLYLANPDGSKSEEWYRIYTNADKNS